MGICQLKPLKELDRAEDELDEDEESDDEESDDEEALEPEEGFLVTLEEAELPVLPP